MKRNNIKNSIHLTFILLVFTITSCKQVKYQEFGSFGGGKFSLNNSAATNNIAVTSVELGSKQTTEIEDYDFPTNASNTKIADIVNLKKPASNAKITRENSRVSIKHVFKAIHKIKSAQFIKRFKESFQKKKRRKRIRRNGAMKIGYYMILFSLIWTIACLLILTSGADKWVMGYLAFGGIFVAMIGAGIWLLGAFVSLLQ